MDTSGIHLFSNYPRSGIFSARPHIDEPLYFVYLLITRQESVDL